METETTQWDLIAFEISCQETPVIEEDLSDLSLSPEG